MAGRSPQWTTPPAARRWDWRAGCGLVCLLLALSGCTNNLRGTKDDPLLSPSRPPVTPRAAAVAPTTGVALGNPVPGASAGSVPPLPSPQPPTSMAALASGNLPPPDPNADLRIPSGNSALASRVQAQGAATVVLNGPKPLDDAPTQPRVGTPIPVAPVSGDTSSKTQADLESRLKAAGVTWSQLNSWADQGVYKFSCRIADQKDPQKLRVIEATANSPTAAMQAVLDQIQLKR